MASPFPSECDSRTNREGHSLVAGTRFSVTHMQVSLYDAGDEGVAEIRVAANGEDALAALPARGRSPTTQQYSSERPFGS
jgi:hypothetical protein